MTRALWVPKKPRWAVGVAVVAGLSALADAVALRVRPYAPDRGVWLAFGIAAFTILCVEALYPLRRWNRWPLRSSQTWLQLHVWGGTLLGVFVLLHSGVRGAGGFMGWCLLLLALWVTGTGLLGAVLQKTMPAMLARNLTVEAIYERIPELVQRLPAEADALVAEGSDVLQSFYRSDVRPAIVAPAPSWSYLLDVRGGRETRLVSFARVSQFVDEKERGALEDLKTIFVEKLELDAHYSVQRALRVWPLLHAPAAMLLLGLAVVHVATFFLY